MPIGRGSPFFSNLLTMGTIAQSHTGNIRPIVAADKIPRTIFLGIILERVSSDINTWIREDKNTPIIIKGNASKIMLIKIVTKLCKKEFWSIKEKVFLSILIFVVSINIMGKIMHKRRGRKNSLWRLFSNLYHHLIYLNKKVKSILILLFQYNYRYSILYRVMKKIILSCYKFHLNQFLLKKDSPFHLQHFLQYIFFVFLHRPLRLEYVIL